MKDRVREALFNLVGPSVKGTHAIDLFAGTGALAAFGLFAGPAPENDRSLAAGERLYDV